MIEADGTPFHIRRSRWRDLTLLWRAQLGPEEWTSLVEALSVGREWRENEQDVVVTLGRAEDSPEIDVNWIYAVDPSRIPDRFVVESSIGVGRLRYESYFQCAVYDDWVFHTLELMAFAMGSALTNFVNTDLGLSSPGHLLLRAWMSSSAHVTEQERVAVYEACLSASVFSGWPGEVHYWTLLLQVLGRDHAVPTEVLLHALQEGQGFVCMFLASP